MDVGKQRVVEIADRFVRIGALIVAGGLEPTPSNYDVLYRYVSDADPQLTEAIDAVLARGDRLDRRALNAIRRSIHGVGTAGLGEVLEKADSQLSRLSAFVEQSGDGARSYRDRLGRSELDDADTADRQRAMLAEMVDATDAMIAQTVALQEELASSADEIERLKADLEIARIESRQDALTGLANRKACCDYLDAQIARALGEEAALALIFLDIDHFKRFNDVFGHRMGDEVLRLVGQGLDRFFHGAGFVSRWGGEEFVAVMPGRSVEEAVDYADRFRQEIAARTLRTRQSGREVGRVTLSLGVAELVSGDTAQALIDRADAALYDAKADGRDRVRRWSKAA